MREWRITLVRAKGQYLGPRRSAGRSAGIKGSIKLFNVPEALR
jgi:hypothetical protein